MKKIVNLAFTDKQRHLMFAVLLIGCMVSAMLQTALTTVLPVIMETFKIGATTGQWLTTAYTLAMGIMIPATPFLMKRFPTKHLFTLSMFIFTLGLLLSAMAPSFRVLMIGRTLQALGTGVLLSLVQVVVLTIYPAHKRGAMMGIYGLAVGTVPIIAPSLAGILVDFVGWHAIFWVATALSFICLVAAQFTIKDISKPEKQSFDSVSMLLSSVGFTGILISMGNFGTQAFFSLTVGVPLLIGILALIAFVLKQKHSTTPFLELAIFRNREFLWSVIGSVLMYAVMMAGTMLLPIYLQIMRGNSVTMTSLIMLPGSLVMAVTSPFAGKIYEKIGIRKLFIFGSFGLLISSIGLCFLGNQTSLWFIIFLFTLRSFAIACFMMPLVTWGMSTLDQKYTSDGTAILSTLRTISGAISPAIFVSVMTLTSKGVPIHGLDIAFVGIALLAAVQCLIAIVWVGRTKKS